jgi:Rad52/22 family double-strand break repair protein
MTEAVQDARATANAETCADTGAQQPAPAADSTAEHKPTLVDEFGAPTKEGWRKIGQLFQTPMATRERNGPGGRSFAYVTARQVADRLDKVIGPGHWATSFRVLSLEDHVVECTLSVFGVSKADVGYSNNPDSENEPEPLKAAFSDAFKRAAVQWGIGRWLYGDT